ncbi:MAG TPA: hypothetical protein DCM07_31790, partial [Planctomycetaceae bacterium]|nr:hypothetical protein [Planctomycetaceae bacterium]
EYGWGPWPALGWGGTADWKFNIDVEGGEIQQIQPCFTTGPLDEFRRDRILEQTPRQLKIQSFTALKQQVDDWSQKAIVMRIQGDADTRISVSCQKPTECQLTQKFSDLAVSNEMLFTRPFPWESAMLHRIVFHKQWNTEFTFTDQSDGKQDDWYYVRVIQSNGEMAWSSPIWV